MNDKIYNIELNKELKGLEVDLKNTKMELQSHQSKLADALKTELGQDINDVLSGKTIIKLSWKEKIKRFFNKIFNAV